jgi:DNA-directed RNA polymerase specialized sigma24 family protein
MTICLSETSHGFQTRHALTGTPGEPAIESRATGAVHSVVLEDLYRAFFIRLVRRVCWRYGLSKDDAQEVVHDAFLLALVKLNVEGNPRAWLYSVVDRLAANWRRKAIRRSRLIEKWQPSEGKSDPRGFRADETETWVGSDFEGGEP